MGEPDACGLFLNRSINFSFVLIQINIYANVTVFSYKNKFFLKTISYNFKKEKISGAFVDSGYLLCNC